MADPWAKYQDAPAADPWAKYQDADPAVTLGQNLRAIPRQVGLAGRYLLEGATGLGQIVGNAMDYGLNKFGVEGQHFGGNLGTTISDAVGLPAPETPTERVVGDASRVLSGAMTFGGAADKAAQLMTGTAQQALTRLGSNLPQQAAAATTSGVAGGSVREAGGGPVEQFVASLIGGLAGGVAFTKVQGAANRASAAVEAWRRPRDIAGRIEFELQRAGVDWNTLSQQARAQLVRDAQEAIYRDQPLNPDALRRLSDFRNIGATPLTGDITQNPSLITQQRNLAKVQAAAPRFGGPNLPEIQNQNARRVLGVFDDVEPSTADAFTTGAAVQGAVRSKDAALRANESSLYATARDTQGRAIPLDREAFVREAYDNLIRENKGSFLPPEIGKILEDIRTGHTTIGGMHGQKMPTNFDVNVIDQLKTTLATAFRGAKDGNVRAAIKAVRDALENVTPTTGQFGGQQAVTGQAADALRRVSALPAESLKAFDAARSASRQRFQWQESAGFIDDALEGVDPQMFVKRHITGAGFQDLLALRKEIGGNQELVGAVRRQLANYILERGRADSDVTRFSSAGMEQAFRALGPQKLALFFSPPELARIRSAINVGKYMQAQPIGSAVNNSNSGTTIIAHVARLIGDVLKNAPVVGPLVAQPAGNAITGVRATIQAQQASNVGNALTIPQPRPVAPAAALLAAPALPRRKDKRGN